jgi:hypothetical protein
MIFRPAARLLCAVCFALGVASPGIAVAEDDGTVEMARQRFREGVSFYDQRQWEKARLAFLQAYALKPHPSILMNLAQSELRGGRPADAAGHFTEYLKGNTEASEAEKQEGELGLAAAKSKVGEVTVTVDVPGAQVSVDGDEKGVAPLNGPLYMAPGAHTVEAKSNDRHASKTVNASAGQAVSTSLSLRGAAASAAPAAAAGAGGGAAPAAAAPAEEHAAAASEEPPVELQESPSADVSTGGRKPFFVWWKETPLAIVGTVVGVVGLGGGVTMAILSHQDYNRAGSLKSQIKTEWETVDTVQDKSLGGGPCDTNQPDLIRNKYQDACTKFQDASNAGDLKKTLAIVGTAVGGVAIVGTVVYYFVDSKTAASAQTGNKFRAQLVPWMGSGNSGLSVVGQF